MNVNIIITEEQKKVLIKESIKSKVEDIIKKNYEFTSKIFKETFKTTGVNLEFMLTWGASIGGFMKPISDFLKTNHLEISDMDLSLILTSIVATLYLENKETLKLLINKLNDNNLYDIFLKGLKKTEEIKYTFTKFLESLNITFSKVSNMLAYAFLVPILPMLYKIEQAGFNSSEIKEMAIRISSFGVITVSSIVIRDILSKILNRFKPNQ